MQPISAGSQPALVPIQVSKTGNRVKDFAAQVAAESEARQVTCAVVPRSGGDGYSVCVVEPGLSGLWLKAVSDPTAEFGPSEGYVPTPGMAILLDTPNSSYTAADLGYLVSGNAKEFAAKVAARIDPTKHRDPITGQDLALYAPATEASGWKSVPLAGSQSQPVVLPPAKPGYHWEKVGGMDMQMPDAAPATEGTGGASSADIISAVKTALKGMGMKLNPTGTGFDFFEK